MLEAFEHGVLNANAGDLPRFRGNTAPNWAIINGEDEVVLIVHPMTEDLDAGPILPQHLIPLDESRYLGDIYESMYRRFPELFIKILLTWRMTR